MAENKTDEQKAAEAQAKQRQADAERAAQQMREQADMTPQQRAAQAEAEAVEAGIDPIDRTVPGGKYRVGADAMGRGGTLVNADGKEITESGKVKE